MTRWLEHADLREVLRKRAQLAPVGATLGWPRLVGSTQTVARLVGARTVLELIDAGRHGQRYTLALRNQQAAALAERVLGGAGQVAVAGKMAALSDAECGVLAYLVAACASASPQSLQLLDVTRADAEQLAQRWASGLCWPISVHFHELTVDLELLCAVEAAPSEVHALQLVVRDGIDPSALGELSAGDLLVGDCWPLSLTTRGLEGAVELQLLGCHEQLNGALAGSQLHVVSDPATLSGDAELVLASLPIQFRDAAQLASGQPHPLHDANFEQVRLRVQGREIASGTLVLHQGALAMRVSQLSTPHSMR